MSVEIALVFVLTIAGFQARFNFLLLELNKIQSERMDAQSEILSMIGREIDEVLSKWPQKS